LAAGSCDRAVSAIQAESPQQLSKPLLPANIIDHLSAKVVSLQVRWKSRAANLKGCLAAEECT